MAAEPAVVPRPTFMNEPNNNNDFGGLLVHLLPKMGDQCDSEQQPMATAAVPSLNVQTLKFPPPDVFDGSEDKFDELEFKMKGFMSLSDVRFRRLMNDAKEATDPINFDKLSSEEQIMTIQFQRVLETLCKDRLWRSFGGRIQTMDSRLGDDYVRDTSFPSGSYQFRD